MRWRWLLAMLLLAAATPLMVQAATPFGDWAAVVVAGDDRSAHDDTPTQAFENARRDVTAALVARGFSGANIDQFSLHPDRYPGDHALRTSPEAVWRGLAGLADRTRGGCLVYVTSHGSPAGVVMDDRLVPPAAMAALVQRTCGARPTAVILSACFSGIFIPALAAPDRLVFTAARRDRASFGCGEKDRYPFFDGCVLEDLPRSADFIDLADQVKRCVAAREDREGMRPRSEPQLFVGAAFRATPRLFATGP